MKVFAVYFSPCGNVKTVVETMAEAAAEKLGAELQTVDFTLPKARIAQDAQPRIYSFAEGDLVFFGTPVYAGRVPNKIMPYVRDAFRGNGAFCVPVVCFGNRSFDDALSELKLLLEAGGFRTVGAAAVVTQHDFSSLLANGRPNRGDLAKIAAFGGSVADKLISLAADKSGSIRGAENITVSAADPAEFGSSVIVPGTQSLEAMKYYTPLRTDGQPAKFLKATPKVKEERCVRCGKCQRVCPMGSIDLKAEGRMTGPCIKCQACIKTCPRGALYFDDPDFLSHVGMLEQNYTRRAESLFIL